MYISELGPKLAARCKRPEVPHPGDGVCPTLQQFNETAAASYELWNNLINDSGHDLGAQDASIQLKSLLQNVPPFQAAPSRCRFLTIEGPHLLLKCSSEFLTTNDSNCDQHVKIIHHHQILGISSPVVYEFLERSESHSFWKGSDSGMPSFLSELIFAWSYILSCRWVETLQFSGEDVQLRQDEEISAHNFWTVILNHKWQAAIHRGGKTYQAPWTLKRLGTELSCNSDTSREFTPMTLWAFDFLNRFCASKDIHTQSITALAIVLTLAAGTNNLIKLPTPCAFLDSTQTSQAPPYICYDEDFLQLDKCITLSCSWQGIESLLCSVFFNPSVPCNLVGAQMTGALEALSQLKDDRLTLTRVMANICPKLSLLWLAVIWTGEAEGVIKCVKGGTQPINLAAASWTGMTESFVQINYLSSSCPNGQVMRAEEYVLTYLTEPEVPPPFTPSPPFGITDETNLSIGVRMHLEHSHIPLTYDMYWILENDDRLPGYPAPLSLNPVKVTLMHANPVRPIKEHNKTDNEEKASFNATCNLFSWHKNIEGGLWLKGGSVESNADVRNMNSHAWIMDTFSDEESIPDEESITQEEQFREDRVKDWQDGLLPPDDPDAQV